MNSFRFMMITNEPKEAKTLIDAGVDRIFVDLELLGKEQRQGHLDTVISRHTIADITRLHPKHLGAECLVRINPVNPGTLAEVDAVIEAGADLVMLPMFQNEDDLKRVIEWIDGRARFCPLIETLSACRWMTETKGVLLNGVDELYFGLNDLHLEMGCRFMFSTLLDERVKLALQAAKNSDVPFGFGGVATLYGGLLSGRFVAALHAYFGSTRVILSRAFRQALETNRGADFKTQFKELRDYFNQCQQDASLTERLADEAFTIIAALEQAA